MADEKETKKEERVAETAKTEDKKFCKSGNCNPLAAVLVVIAIIIATGQSNASGEIAANLIRIR